LRIYNPDGSEAEKSGNGIRIFARWLYDTGRTQGHTVFSIATLGGHSTVEISAERHVTVDMGKPVFRDDLVELVVAGLKLRVVALSVGNPHCVVLRDRLGVRELRRLGPLIEHHPAFTKHTNVQLARVRDRTTVELLIWERGAGETQASGSSACAVVAACQHRGLVEALVDVTAVMPGGELCVRLDAEGRIWQRGPAEEVARVRLSDELISRLQALP
jgi:diaminopimelate epimerase